MDYLLGVDGGNTKTIAVIARPDGTIVGSGRAGCSDIYGAPSDEDALGQIASAVHEAAVEAGIETDAVDWGGFSLAGADWPEDYVFLEGELLRRGLSRRTAIVNDALGPLWAAGTAATGVSVVCGTGLAIGARNARGALWHGSFWLESIGAGTLGSRALRAAMRDDLGIGPQTELRVRIPAAMGATSIEDALHRATARGRESEFPRGHLAPVLLDAAEAGDAVAREIVAEAGRSIAEFALVAACTVGLTGSYDIVLSGGVFRHTSRLLPHAIVETVQATHPAAHPLFPPFEPAVGALIMAFEHAGITADDAVVDRLIATAAPRALSHAR
jgi:N-acetylglucosamine kinase-like BadF-type ATPase